jgi:predicted GTPase
MLKVIEAYPPPATREICKIKYCMQLPTKHLSLYFFNMPQYVKEPYKRYLENKIRELGFFRVPIDIYIREIRIENHFVTKWFCYNSCQKPTFILGLFFVCI